MVDISLTRNLCSCAGENSRTPFGFDFRLKRNPQIETGRRRFHLPAPFGKLSAEEPMPRGLDHIVHAVRDLDAVGDLYARMGFRVGARNRHPWGTHNRLVQFPGFFIEILTFAEPQKLGTDGFSTLFAAYNRDFAAAHEGLSMIILESRDAAADHTAFERAEISASPVIYFEREGKRPDVATVKVGFSLAFAEDRQAPEIHFATCQQHYPENFWNPEFQRHDNGATGIAEAVVVSNSPAVHREMLLAFTGASESTGSADGYAIALPRGRIAV
jgi:catechol 2,3-dioxygenase-like lactoylglutathione lyase family enzyme